MSGAAIDPKVRARRLAIRSGAVLLYAVLVGLFFVYGKRHTLLIDNKDAPDGSYSAIDGIMVSVDGKEPLELYAGDRDMVVVQGQAHSIAVEGIMDSTNEKRSFELPIDEDMLILYVPKMLAGGEPYIERFTPRDAAAAPSDGSEGNGGESFSAPLSPEEGAAAEAPPEPPAP